MSDSHSEIESVIVSIFTFVTTIGTIGFLFYIGISLAVENYATDINLGIRSISGLLLPWIIMTFISRAGYLKPSFMRNPNALVNLLVFAIFIVIGYIVMLALGWFSEAVSPGVPLREIVISGVLSMLIFSSINVYYFGIFTGILLHIVLNGIPIDIINNGLMDRI